MREDIESYLAGEVDFPDDMAEAFWLSDVATDGRSAPSSTGAATSSPHSSREIRAACERMRPSRSFRRWRGRPAAPGMREAICARSREATGIVEACFYEPSVERVRADIRDTQRRLHGAGRLRGILRPSFPDFQSRSELVAAAQALRDAGISGDRVLQLRHSAPRAISPGLPTHSPCSESDGVFRRRVSAVVEFRTRSSPSLARPAASVRSCAGISAERAPRSPRSTAARP